MAEQVINAVYALAEHPDVFCNVVIKNLTVRAFSRPKSTQAPDDDGEKAPTEKEAGDDNDLDAAMDKPQPGDMTVDDADITMLDATQDPKATQDTNGGRDIGDAFELSQLLFVVGHVAIKQIVFLELVEREWKRQKDEKLAGNCCSCSSRDFIHHLI